ncbi:MAG: F0F1 ATP synthase subunit delta [Pseudomonadales bacterium]|jgi:F0F1-type ATP synthase delta subunit|nr:F0F1 ATP synthase subunit delta [Pseudomonadales bacterium]
MMEHEKQIVEEITSLVASMSKRGEWQKVEKLIEKLQNITDQENRAVRITINSAQTLTDSELSTVENFIKNKFGANQVIVTENIKPETVGLTVQTKDRLFDLSTNHQIKRLSKQLRV